MMDYTKIVLDTAFHVHSELGPGLLKSAYQACLTYELDNKGILVEVEKPLPLIYKGIKLDCGYRIDLLVEKQLLVEIKAIDELNKIHLAQMLTYLRLSKLRYGLIINFNVSGLKDGIQRVVNGY